MVTNTLWAFDYPRGIIAFQFRTKEDADIFAIKIKSASPSLKDYEVIRKEKIEQAKKEKEENSFFGRVKKKLFHDEK